MVAVFHKIVDKDPQNSEEHTIEQILAYEGEVTFDGAYSSLWKHRKVLGEKKPTLFVQGNTVGTPGVMTQKQIESLKTLGWQLGWHTWSHRDLTELGPSELRDELNAPSWLVEPIFAYPYGNFSDMVIRYLKGFGYKKAYSTTQGDNSEFSLHREYI